jgi:hypothetical protein
MAIIARIPVVWDGLPGLPGVSVFYSAGTDSSAAVAALTTFFNAIKGSVPASLSWQIPSGGDTLDETDGTLFGSWTGASGTVISSTGGAGTYAAGVGFRVKWLTNGIAAHKRVTGSTFIVPLLGSLYDSNGTIAAAQVTAGQTAANALVAAGVMKIWHRGSVANPTGVAHLMQGAVLPDKVATLRSRRV